MKCKTELHRDSILNDHVQETKANAGEGVERREPLLPAGGVYSLAIMEIKMVITKKTLQIHCPKVSCGMSYYR